MRHDGHPSVILRRLTLADLPEIAAVHQVAFPRTLACRFGREALRRQCASLMTGLYAPEAVGAFQQGSLVGFCFVGVRHVAEGHFLRQHAGFLDVAVSLPPVVAD